MDVIPIAAKVEGEIGTGVTNYLNGVVVVLTGVDEEGTQVHEFGSSNGFMDETIIYGRPGCPDQDDIIIRVHAVLERLTGMERRGPMTVHAACDNIIQEIRDVIKNMDASAALNIEKRDYVKRHGRPRVLLVKEIMGQGAMHDNIILPAEPAGYPGGRANVDLGNVPLVLNVNEVRDGGIHAVCCIGPASKEMTRHYFREPLVELMANDPEINLVGVVFVGSPQVNDEKTFVSKRLGAMADTMLLEGCIVTTEGFGNNHVDFASHIEEMGKRGIKVVGVSYCAYQGQLVVGNQYMDAMVELNKDAGGFESERLGENTLTAVEARRALLMLKNKLAGVPIAGPENKWSPQIVEANIKIADSAVKTA
jgi:D-proline reductase (dithiol) PrdA